MITWVLVTKDCPIALKLSFSVRKLKGTTYKKPQHECGEVFMYWVCTTYTTYVRCWGCTENNEMVPVPKKLVNGLIKQLPPASWLPTAGAGWGATLFPRHTREKAKGKLYWGETRISPAPQTHFHLSRSSLVNYICVPETRKNSNNPNWECPCLLGAIQSTGRIVLSLMDRHKFG